MSVLVDTTILGRWQLIVDDMHHIVYIETTSGDLEILESKGINKFRRRILTPVAIKMGDFPLRKARMQSSRSR